MQPVDMIAKARETLQQFQDGYTLRDLSTLDKSMD
jgi:hypothetical protein